MLDLFGLEQLFKSPQPELKTQPCAAPRLPAYQLHHFNCPFCIAAGKGYGLRCSTGAALYTAYSDATQRTTP